MSDELCGPSPVMEPTSNGETSLCHSVGVIQAGHHGADVLVYAVDSRQAHWVSIQQAELLRRCGVPRTIDDHVREIERLGVYFGSSDDLRRDVRDLARRELLQAEARSEPARSSVCPPDASPHVNVVGFVTRDRPQCLERALTTLLENLERYGRHARVIVCDDSRRSSSRRRNDATLADARRRFRVPLDVVTAESRDVAAQQVSRYFSVPVRLARWALHGGEPWEVTTGANRNALLLAAAGEVVVSLDDDIVCRFVRSQWAHEAPSISTAHEACEYWFYRDREELLRDTRVKDEDLLGLHERLLGRDVTSLISSQNDRGLSAMERRRLVQKRATVRVTQLGVAGDVGMSSPQWLDLEGRSRSRLLSDNARYRTSLTSREVVRMVPSPLISTGAFFMAGCTGFDSRITLPPFVPVARNADAVFSVLVRSIWPAALLGHLPFAILHFPAEARLFTGAALLDRISRLTMADVLLLCIASCPLLDGQAGGAPRYERIGGHLHAIGKLSWEAFHELLRIQSWRYVCRMLDHWRRTLDKHGAAPLFWAEDVRRVLDELREKSLNPEYVIPSELRNRRPAAALGAARRVVRDFGELLIAWPAIAQAMKSGEVAIQTSPA